MKDLLKATVLKKQRAINGYIEMNAELKQELAEVKIETERVNNLMRSYQSSEYVINRIYPTVAAYKFEESEENYGKKTGLKYNRVPNPMWDGYTPRDIKKVAEALNPNRKSDSINGLPDDIYVTFIASDTNHESELIKKVLN
ncbi:hypothetical protein Hanom_Chr17g01564781 [Helianthus anomalus]